MRASQLRTDDVAWIAALRDSLAAPTVEDALGSALRRLTPPTAAHASAFAQRGGSKPRATWNCEAIDVLPLVGRDDIFGAEADGSGASLWLEGAAAGAAGEDGGGGVLAVPAVSPLESRVCLLLFYPAASTPTAAHREKAVGLASLGGLLLEREFLAEEAHRAREARDHFLIAIHHELRTPATAVMLETGLLHTGMLGNLPPRLTGALGRLESHVGELVRVIQRVLDLGELENSAASRSDELVDPRKMVVEIARRVEPTAERRGIAIALFFPKVLPVLQTDGARFRRILLYLLANALKYTERGRVQVTVEREQRIVGQHRREPYLVIRVVDTGRGIPAEEIERIFEPFAQVEEGARTDSATRGVGLGLSLARKLARSLGGDVTVESTVGEGTTARFAVPYRQPQPE